MGLSNGPALVLQLLNKISLSSAVGWWKASRSFQSLQCTLAVTCAHTTNDIKVRLCWLNQTQEPECLLFCLRNIKNYVNSLARTIKQFVRQNQSLDFISVETGLKVKIDWPAVAAGITVNAGVGGGGGIWLRTHCYWSMVTLCFSYSCCGDVMMCSWHRGHVPTVKRCPVSVNYTRNATFHA